MGFILNWERKTQGNEENKQKQADLRPSEEETATSTRVVLGSTKVHGRVLMLIAARSATSRINLLWSVSETKWHFALPPRVPGQWAFPGPGGTKSMCICLIFSEWTSAKKNEAIYETIIDFIPFYQALPRQHVQSSLKYYLE